MSTSIPSTGEATTGTSDADSASSRRKSPGDRPFSHFRLIAFFAGTALLGVVSGILRLRRLGDPPPQADVQWILASTVVLTALVGFVGVFVHRLRVLPQKWRETESYVRAIQRESQKYRALMEGAADMLLIVDPETGRLREWNARAREELGLPASPEAALAIGSVVHEEDLARVEASLRDAGAAPLSGIRLRGAGGRTLVADARLAVIALEDERIVQVSLRDLTRQKEMERQLQIHERLSSVGLLTAGVAHEINNPLEGIGNYLKLLEREDDDPEKRRRNLEQVRHGFARIREIVRDLLRFARPAGGEGEADLAQVVERARKLSAYSERMKGVEIAVEGLDEPLRVVGDAGRLEQVVVNLLLNAGAAMGSKGRVTVRARRGPEVELAVLDEGPGIPPADLDRIFDPFFTTTAGTGLGLSVSYGIVRAHGGTLSAQNREGGGAELVIRLPGKGRA